MLLEDRETVRDQGSILGPCIPNFFLKFESSFESERVFRESRRDEFYVIFRYFRKFWQNAITETRE